MALDRESFMAKAKSGCKVEEVQIPEWEDSVFVRQITCSERDLFEAQGLDLKGSQRYVDLRAKFLLLALCDKDGKRLYGDADLVLLGSIPGSVADLIWDRAWKLNRMAKEDFDGLAKTSEAVKTAG